MLNTYKNNRHCAAGFTLIEAIIAIVITGILAGMVATFIAKPVTGYLLSERRADLTDTADLVLRRLSREVHVALPNSVRVRDTGGNVGNCLTGTCYIEFIPTSGGGAYRDSVSDGSTGGNSLDFADPTPCATTPSNCTFDVLGVLPSSPLIAVGDFIVVYNQGQSGGNSYAPADAYATGDQCSDCNRAQVIAPLPSSPGNTVTLNPSVMAGGNVFASYTPGNTPPLKSKTQRFNVVPGSVRAVTYACPIASGTFSRYANYGFYSAQTAAITAATGTTPVTLALNASCTAVYNSTASQRNGLLTVTLTLRDSSGQDSVTLVREIHLDNTP